MFSENDFKKPNEKTDRKSIMCSKNVLSCVLSALLVILVVMVTVQFFYPIVTYERIFLENSIVRTQEQNKKELEFSLNPKSLCSTDDGVQLLVLVASNADHVDERTAIRKTWGSVANSQETSVRLAFVVDSTDVSQVSEKLAEESAFYGDIIQPADSTPKSVAMLKWVSDHCADVRYFLKTEDDTFINVGVVTELLSQEPFASHPKFIGGFVMQAEEQQPELPTMMPEVDKGAFNKYISGSAYITRGPTAVELYEAMLDDMHPGTFISPFQEDFFITGQCGRDVGVALVHEPLFAPLPMTPFSPETCGSYASSPGLSPIEMQMLWSTIQDGILGAISGILEDGQDKDDVIKMPFSSSITLIV